MSYCKRKATAWLHLHTLCSDFLQPDRCKWPRGQGVFPRLLISTCLALGCVFTRNSLCVIRRSWNVFIPLFPGEAQIRPPKLNGASSVIASAGMDHCLLDGILWIAQWGPRSRPSAKSQCHSRTITGASLRLAFALRLAVKSISV